MGNFEKLRVWHDALNLATDIYSVSNTDPFCKDFGLRNQIQRAAVSIASNIAEGDERGSDRASVYFFNIAKGAAAEVITQLYIAQNIGYLDHQSMMRLKDDAEKIRASLINLIKSRDGYKNL